MTVYSKSRKNMNLKLQVHTQCTLSPTIIVFFSFCWKCLSSFKSSEKVDQYCYEVKISRIGSIFLTWMLADGVTSVKSCQLLEGKKMVCFIPVWSFKSWTNKNCLEAHIEHKISLGSSIYMYSRTDIIETPVVWILLILHHLSLGVFCCFCCFCHCHARPI